MILKLNWRNIKMFVKLEDTEPEIWTKEMIQELSAQQVKELMGFAETLTKMRLIANMYGSYEADAYALSIQMKMK